jgi:transcriptional regulator with PAS, ATPase and Fis domain
MDLQKIINDLDLNDLAAADPSLKERLEPTVKVILRKFLSTHKPIEVIKERIELLEPEKLPVLIIGETGTGKELLAQALHGNRNGSFIPVNCAGIPDTLLEAEFFGCVPGAFTGSVKRNGYLRSARGGTLFLDEIGDMPPLLQSKLLRVLQENKSRPIGSDEEYQINCRFISATNRSLEILKDEKIFRKDLFYRLAGTIIKVPPLRERGLNDIKLICAMNGLKTLPLEIGEIMMNDKANAFPGNVRQLLNLIEEIKILGEI